MHTHDLARLERAATTDPDAALALARLSLRRYDWPTLLGLLPYVESRDWLRACARHADAPRRRLIARRLIDLGEEPAFEVGGAPRPLYEPQHTPAAQGEGRIYSASARDLLGPPVTTPRALIAPVRVPLLWEPWMAVCYALDHAGGACDMYEADRPDDQRLRACVSAVIRHLAEPTPAHRRDVERSALDVRRAQREAAHGNRHRHEGLARIVKYTASALAGMAGWIEPDPAVIDVVSESVCAITAWALDTFDPGARADVVRYQRERLLSWMLGEVQIKGISPPEPPAA